MPKQRKKFKQAEFTFMVDWKILIQKPLVDPKVLQSKICLQYSQKERTSEEVSPVFSKLTKHLGSIFSSDKIVIPGELQKQMVDALHFRQAARLEKNAGREQHVLVVRDDKADMR